MKMNSAPRQGDSQEDQFSDRVSGLGKSLEVARSAGVVTVVLDRPSKMNAINSVMWEGLLGVFRQTAASPDDRCLVLTGSGGQFSSGVDLADPPGESRRQLLRDVMVSLYELPKPTIAKVRGVAAGAAMSLALACDLVVASEDARFSQIFSRRGLSPDCAGTWLVPRAVGLRKAKELAFFGDWVSAGEAARLGLINCALPEDHLDLFVSDWASALAAGPPVALHATKRLLNSSLDFTLVEAIEAEFDAQIENIRTPEFQAAMKAFRKEE